AAACWLTDQYCVLNCWAGRACMLCLIEKKTEHAIYFLSDSVQVLKSKVMHTMRTFPFPSNALHMTVPYYRTRASDECLHIKHQRALLTVQSLNSRDTEI